MVTIIPRVKTNMTPMRYMWRKLIQNTILFFWVWVMALSKKLWKSCEKIMSKAPLFSSVISGILERGRGVGRRLRLYSSFSNCWRPDAGWPFGWGLVRPFNARRWAKAHISNYTDLTALLTSADLKWEVPHDMVEWIWIHMAINAGVTDSCTFGESGKIQNSWLWTWWVVLRNYH